MRHRFVSIVVLGTLFLSLTLPSFARADGIIVVEPPQCQPECSSPTYIRNQLIVKQQRVDVEIDNQIATTRIDQIFHNPNDWVAEGMYIFPIPDGATVDKFTMEVDGQPIEAKILDAEEARQIYDDIVRKMRDPALLEYVGRGALQANIFPIEPGQDRHIQIEYQQILTAENGLVRYIYPLNSERFSAQPLQEASIHIAVTSADPIHAIYSPTHQIAVNRDGENRFTAGWESTDVIPNTDFELVYSVSPDQIGANLLSFWDATDEEGTFLLLVAPGIQTDQPAIAKDVLLVLDTSGSMNGEKIVQAKAAVTYILNHLNSEDRFNIIEFSTGDRVFASGLQDANSAEQATQWVDKLTAQGGTDINKALLDAMSMVQPERPTYLLFLTDGLPTEGETNTADIIANVKKAAPSNVRLFAFGVGYDVDTVLLDSLVQNHHGVSTYVEPGQSIDEIVSSFYGKISTPVLTNVELALNGAHIDEIYPQPLPDLFAGTQLAIVGKYRAGGPVAIEISGQVNGQSQTFTYEGQTLTSTDGAEYLPRLWATRKIGYLLQQIRLHGENQEWIQAIVDLSVRYGIVTPYTSYLVTEADILTEQGRAAAADTEATRAADAPAPASGADAVGAAAAANTMSGSGFESTTGDSTLPSGEYADRVKIVGSRTFLLKDGVWIDTTFDPSKMETIHVTFASDEYFQLLSEHPDLADALALGTQVIVMSNGVAYEIVE